MARFGTTARLFGGVAVDRARYRELLPDFRWVVRAAGMVDPRDASTATITIGYVQNNGTFTVLGTTTKSGAGVQKFTMGPFDVFDPALAHPKNEDVPILRLRAVKSAGIAGDLLVATLWLELYPSRGAA